MGISLFDIKLRFCFVPHFGKVFALKHLGRTLSALNYILKF